MEMWIILACLVGVVLMLLVFTTLHDRKKRKRIAAKKFADATAIEAARQRVVTEINRIIAENANRVKDFVPSIGEFKMSDIRNLAREQLEKVKNSTDFRQVAVEKANADLVGNFKKLETLSANTWVKDEILVKFFYDAQAPKKVEMPKIERLPTKKRGLMQRPREKT